MIVRIGYTKSDRLNGYVPAFDGYKADAQQDTVYVRIPGQHPLKEVAEAIFEATNAPLEAMSGRARYIADYLSDLAETNPFIRSMSVGDTVTECAEGRPTVVCARFGWDEITLD